MNNELKKLRASLHQIPELGRKEFKTQEFILAYAKNLKCKIYKPTLTSVVLYFDNNCLNTICFRADMDALPICENTNKEYKSLHEGIMHACGHDGHMAMLLGFAKYASLNLEELKNNIVCLFQPSEEDNAGANDILDSKILDTLNVKRIFGFHIWPTLEGGKIFTMPNGMLATSAEIDIDIEGKSCHAANRDSGIDALYAGTTLINEFYEAMDKIKERHLISFGKITSGEVRNSVAKNCHIEATMRAFDDDVFNKMKDELLTLSKKIEDKTHARIKININAAYPAVLNDESLVNEYKEYLDLYILDKPFLQAEDFGCYTRKYKSMFMLIGCGDLHYLHTNTFDFNEDILNVGFDAYKRIAKKEIS